MVTYVKRRYICKKCATSYLGEKVTVKGTVDNIEPCPHCNNLKPKIIEPSCDRDLRKGPLAVKAVDYTYKMAERDYGMTDMRDNLRAGDLAMKIPSGPVGDTLQKQGGMFGAQGAQQAISHHGSAMGMASRAKAERLAQNAPDPMTVVQNQARNHASVIDANRRGLGIRAK